MIDIEAPNKSRIFLDNKLSIDNLTKLYEYLNRGVLIFVNSSEVTGRDLPNNWTYNLNYERAMFLLKEIGHADTQYYKVKYKILRDNISIYYERTFGSGLEPIIIGYNLQDYKKLMDYHHGQCFGNGSVYEDNQIHKALDVLLVEQPELFNEKDSEGNVVISLGKVVGQMMRLLKGKANPAMVNEIVNSRLKLL